MTFSVKHLNNITLTNVISIVLLNPIPLHYHLTLKKNTMKTIEVKVYQFAELSDKAKQRAIEKFSDINVDFDWWDFVYEDFKSLADCFGIEVDTKKTYFSGFSHQGQGSSFTADIDVKKLLDCVKDESWKDYAPNEKLSFYSATPEMYRVIDLFSAYVEPTNRESSIKVVCNLEAGEAYPNIYAALESLEELVTDVCETLNHWFFTTLEKEYYYLTSEAAIIETIEINNYDFTEDGNLF